MEKGRSTGRMGTAGRMERGGEDGKDAQSSSELSVRGNFVCGKREKV
jgi:hypothetical protein